MFIIFHTPGLISSVHAILRTRTPQGAIAWVVSLNAMPVLAVQQYTPVFSLPPMTGSRPEYTAEDQEYRNVGTLLAVSRFRTATILLVDAQKWCSGVRIKADAQIPILHLSALHNACPGGITLSRHTQGRSKVKKSESRLSDPFT